jgi:hypothetical protein
MPRARRALVAARLALQDIYPWDAEIATLPVVGSYMTEVEFFHRAAHPHRPDREFRTGETQLVLPASVDVDRRRSAPHGGLPRDLRLTFTWRHRRELGAVVEMMIGWNPERIIIAHGRWHEANGAAEFSSLKTKDRYRLFFIPVTEAGSAGVSSKDNTKRFILLANGPKTTKVLLGTVAKAEKEPPVVTEEKQVVGKKVQEDNGLLKRIFKCSATGCAGAAGCVLSGPGWLPCLCLSCGTVIAACSVTEIFLP